MMISEHLGSEIGLVVLLVAVAHVVFPPGSLAGRVATHQSRSKFEQRSYFVATAVTDASGRCERAGASFQQQQSPWTDANDMHGE